MFSHLHGGKVAPYKTEPKLKDEELIEECEEVADEPKHEPFGDLGCPVPPEVE